MTRITLLYVDSIVVNYMLMYVLGGERVIIKTLHFAILSLTLGYSQTEVSGNISGIWSLESSPNLITQQILVP